MNTNNYNAQLETIYTCVSSDSCDTAMLFFNIFITLS